MQAPKPESDFKLRHYPISDRTNKYRWPQSSEKSLLASEARSGSGMADALDFALEISLPRPVFWAN